MPTIKDVARLAGVSHGTVSNIINGSKSVNSDTVKRVELAMKELGYQPDAKARSLRSSRTTSIGVVLPNIVDSIYSRLYTGIEKIARGRGYSLSLYTTNDSPEIEEQVLNRIQQQRMDGAILITCMPEQTERFEQLTKAGVKLMFVRRRPEDMFGEAFACIDERQAVFDATTGLLQRGFRDLALLTGKQTYSNEQDCAEGFCAALRAAGMPVDKNALRSTDAGKENAFRATAWWMQSGNVPQVIITTCGEFAKGALAAVEMFKNAICPVIISLDNESWTQNIIPSHIIRCSQKYMLLGELAADKLLRHIQGEDEGPADNIVLAGSAKLPPLQKAALPVRRAAKENCLRIAMMESAASYASRIISPRFTQQTGIEVEIDTFPYDEIYTQTIDSSHCYDLLQVNLAWMSEAVFKNKLLCLDEHFHGKLGSFSDDIIQQYGRCGGHLYAMPYMFDVQMLFYRKDIFDDLRFQRMYYETYKSTLRVPKTWAEYDQIAAFFTQQYNHEVPTQFGTTLGGAPFYAIYGLIPRLWAAGCCILDANDNIKLNTPRAVRVLEDYVKAFSYADPAAISWDWSEQTKQFCQGTAAMMTIYQAHFTDHINQYESKVNGKIGFAALPGNISIRGGWSLGVSEACSQKEAALQFLEWTCSAEEAIPYNILGGSMPCKNVFESIEMAEAYPWFSSSYQGLKNSRDMMENNRSAGLQWRFELAAGQVVHQCIRGELSAQEAIQRMEAELVQIMSSI